MRDIKIDLRRDKTITSESSSIGSERLRTQKKSTIQLRTALRFTRISRQRKKPLLYNSWKELAKGKKQQG